MTDITVVKELWGKYCANDFKKYFAENVASSLEKAINQHGYNLLGIYKDAVRVGSLTYRADSYITGEKYVSVMQLAAKGLEKDDLFATIKLLEKLENAIVVIHSHRSGFNKMLKQYGFKQIETIWSLESEQ